MRKAAGILLIILGTFEVVLMIIDLSYVRDLGLASSSLLPMIWGIVFGRIVSGGLLVAGGVLCLRRRYWGLCLVSALLPLLISINDVVLKDLTGGDMLWRFWVPLPGQLIATIFISVRKGEWSESQA